MNEIDHADVYAFFREHPERPFHVQDVQTRLKIDDRSALRNVLKALTDEGKLIRTRRNTYGLPQEMNLLLGKLQVTAGGYGFVIPDEGGKDLFIPADRMSGAWDGDKVVARPDPLASDDGRRAGEIVRILERKHDRVVGTLEYARGYAILRPDSPKLRERILLTPDSVGELEAGSRIVVRMVWPEASGETDPFGEVEEYLGVGDDPEIETRAVIVKFGLKDEFDPKTLAEAGAVPPQVSGELLTGRTDYRHINTVTIDGVDAKDFDDAVSVERIGEGPNSLLRVGVHIADVSYYVAEGTSLDAEARERATSVYLPGKVLPMLPEELSNGICSLVEGEARLALSVFVDITRDAEVQAVKFKETVIKSDARLTYDDVQEFADGGRLPHGKRKLERDIKLLINLTQKLRHQRISAGALDFQFSETKVEVDDDGNLHLMPIRSNEARQLIEELMLLANRVVAKELDTRGVPALYRVHEDPSEEKLQALQQALAKLGYTLDLTQTSPQDLQQILYAASGKPEAQLVSTLLLRSLKQARYSAENLGHYGLAFENYLHFTSPIRRYPDLVVHRVLRSMLHHRLSPTLKERMRTDFPGLAEHTSERERVAEDAERDLTRYYHARWAKQHIGEVFAGVISGVTNFGLFVALPNGVEGLIHVSNLDDDYYLFLEDSLMLMGKSTRKKFRLGDRLEVRIFQSNPTIRQIDLLPGYMQLPDADPAEAEEQRRAAKPGRRPKPKAAAGRGKGKEAPAARPGGNGSGRPARGVDAQEPAPAVEEQVRGAQERAPEAPEGDRGDRERKRASPEPAAAPAEEAAAAEPGAPDAAPAAAPGRDGRPRPAAQPRRRVLVFGDPNRWK